jgi:hypothetical protein
LDDDFRRAANDDVPDANRSTLSPRFHLNTSL